MRFSSARILRISFAWMSISVIVSRAVQLSGSDQGIVYEFDEASQIFHARATHDITPEHLEKVRAAPIRLGEGAIGRAGVT